MAKKTGDDRFGDSVAYIRTHIHPNLADHLTRTVGAQQDNIGEELSLGTRWDVFTKDRDPKTQQRRALRSLILCQRVYYSNLWPCLMGTTAAPTAHNWLAPNWKKVSTDFWGPKSEAEIREGIRMFIATSNNAADAANSAQAAGPPGGSTPALTATRTRFGGPPTATCYDAVMLWLFKSGLVSLRWLLKNRNANTKQTLNEAFGRGTQIWSGAYTDTHALPAVPRGHVLHIFENESAWRGHWMISNGGGNASGCNNNDETPPVSRSYCSTLSIHKQLLDFGTGVAIVIDPTSIPDRN